MFDKMFNPIKLRGLELKNRVVLPGAETMMGENLQRLTDYHVAIVKGGCGLNILECAAIHPTTHGDSYIPLYKPEHADYLKPFTKAIHDAGGKCAIQIWHGGFVPLMFLPEGQDGWFPAMMNEDQVHEVVKAFGYATKLAVEAGFDAMELHGAHSYLIHEFLSSGLNMYFGEGGYNGDRDARAKFMIEVIDEMRANMPEDMPLILRIDVTDDTTPNGCNEEDYVYFANIAIEHGVDALDLSRGLSAGDELKFEVPSMDLDRGYNLPFIKYFKEHCNTTIIGGHRIITPEMAEEWLDNGYCDMVFVGRGQITDHEWVNKAQAGKSAEIRHCMGCMHACYEAVTNRRDHITCVRNPMVGWEGKPLEKTGVGKKALVIGGGYAGIQSAQFLHAKGFEVSLYEKSSSLGGTFKFAGMPMNKQEMAKALMWDLGELERENVDVHVGQEVTPELIEKIKPDVVFVATGAKATVPELPGVENTITFVEAMSGAKEVGKKVAVIGSAFYVGIDTALWLCNNGHDTTCITADMRPNVGCMGRGTAVFNVITEQGLNCIPSATVTGFEAGKVLYKTKEGEEASFEADTIVTALGLESKCSCSIVKKCEELGITVKKVGFAGDATDLYTTSESVRVAVTEI